jgi:pSer/pThr/pTyr-binding forkhead associated (FHA) protein
VTVASLVAPDGSRIELNEDENLIGRGGREFGDPNKVDVGPMPGGATVSRHHAQVYRQAGQWYLRVDPNARNPTLVAGQRISGGDAVPLADDTRIQLGDVVLIFRSPVEAALPRSDQTMAELPAQTIPPETAPLAPPPPVAAPVISPPAPPPSEPAPAMPPPAVAWPGRLPNRPATLATFGVGELKRVNPFRGLMIDEEAWRDAHDYHRLQAQLHLLTGHGWGIVEGLEVLADAQAPNTLVVRPGIAIDPQGRVLLITQERRLAVSPAPGTTLYVSVRWREELAAPQRFWNDLDEYTRVVEKSETQVQTAPPAAPALELARVTAEGPLRNAADLLNPGRGELDLRFRERLTIRPRPDLGVAQIVLDADGGSTRGPRNQLGLRYLLREIDLTSSYRARWAGAFRLGDPLPPVALVYLAGSRGFSVDDAARRALGAALQAGAVVFVDGAPGDGAAELAATVEGLAAALGRELKPVQRWHPLLTARHIFAQPPLPEPDGAALRERDGLVVSAADYGGAWQGGSAEQPLPRETIRAALELGVNVAVYARQRQRPLEALEIEG